MDSEQAKNGLNSDSTKERRKHEALPDDVFKKISTRCFELAAEALDAGEVPVGCVFLWDPPQDIRQDVSDNKDIKWVTSTTDLNHKSYALVAEARNRVNEKRDATRHAEIECIAIAKQWAKDFTSLQTERDLNIHLWPRIQVWVTLEPCIMCARALRFLSPASVHYGGCNSRFGGCGSMLEVHSDPRIAQPALDTFPKALDPDRAVELLRLFYSRENPNAPEAIRKRKVPRRTTPSMAGGDSQQNSSNSGGSYSHEDSPEDQNPC